MTKKLKSDQIKIDSVKRKEHALSEQLILLKQNKIKKLLNEKIAMNVFESIDSTNDYLKSFSNAKEIKICLSEHMTKGRGRLDREWYSPFGKNIYMSCLYPFKKSMNELSGLSLAMTLVIIKTLKNFGINEHLFVKWPNDIVFKNQKMAGILIEMQTKTFSCCQAIIGIGLNVNMTDDACHISQAWTSMQKILGKALDRNTVCAELINNLLNYLRQFEAHGFQHFVNEWMESDCLMHQTITLKNIDKQVKGKVISVNEQGHLLLKLADGTVHAFSAGDTSIVKKRQSGTD